jgi:hypothetical protein
LSGPRSLHFGGVLGLSVVETGQQFCSDIGTLVEREFKGLT